MTTNPAPETKPAEDREMRLFSGKDDITDPDHTLRRITSLAFLELDSALTGALAVLCVVREETAA